MELYADTHNTRQVLLYADLCANQWEGDGGGGRGGWGQGWVRGGWRWMLGSCGEKLDPTPSLQQDLE